MAPTEESVLQALEVVIDPDFNRNIVELGFVKNLEIQGGKISFDIVLTTPACPVKEQFKNQAFETVNAIPGVESVDIRMTASTSRSASVSSDNVLMQDVRNVLAIASGKGGVGKSTVTANLATALAKKGARVGVLDADIYGPSMVMMFGIDEVPRVNEDGSIHPVRVASGITVISMAMFAEDDKALIWRGPMVAQMINNFITRVHWGELDYLLVDLPPGTGDVQLTLTQNCPLSGGVIVTTPQDVSVIDARRAVQMFETVAVPVLGVVENMSYFVPPDLPDRKYPIFGSGGGERISRSTGSPFLGEIPIESPVALGGDGGVPVTQALPESASAKAFIDIAGKLASQLAILGEKSGMTSFDLAWKDLELTS